MSQSSEYWLEPEAQPESVALIGDREADIYEEWVRVPHRQTHVLIRACRDRSIVGTAQTLFAYLSEQRCEGTYCLTVMADTHHLFQATVSLDG